MIHENAFDAFPPRTGVHIVTGVATDHRLESRIAVCAADDLAGSAQCASSGYNDATASIAKRSGRSASSPADKSQAASPPGRAGVPLTPLSRLCYLNGLPELSLAGGLFVGLTVATGGLP